MPRYKQYLWFSKDTIPNIIALKNLINKYKVKYDRLDKIFAVHREDREKPKLLPPLNFEGGGGVSRLQIAPIYVSNPHSTIYTPTEPDIQTVSDVLTISKKRVIKVEGCRKFNEFGTQPPKLSVPNLFPC